MIVIMIIIVVIGFLFYNLQESDLWSNHLFIKIRWIFFIPLSLIMLAFILSIPLIIFNILYDLNWWQIILAFFSIAGILSFFFELTISPGTGLVLNICPHYKISTIMNVLFSILITANYIYNVWSEGKYPAINFKSTFHSIGVTVTIIPLLIFIIASAIEHYNDVSYK